MRLVTRADLDGLTCAVLLSECETIDSVELLHPQDVTDRRIPIGPSDILANLPYHPSCGMWFDNHLLTDAKAMPPTGFRGRYGKAPSAARLVYEHYVPDRPALARFDALVAETDRLDSAQLTMDDVMAPSGYVLVGLTLDPRTGLGSPREYFDLLLPAVRERPVAEVVELPEVRARVARLREQDRAFREALLAHSRQDANVVVTDLRPLDPIPVGNRFLVFTLYPRANVGVRVEWARDRQKVAVSAGRSIFNRTSRANLGVLMSL
ncbi:MAG TPA: exopolyphosphatase, partial [Vicinamibacteria bacterium]|nr:exopolyphosphatase [Vicinamibacteria bacterium]